MVICLWSKQLFRINVLPAKWLMDDHMGLSWLPKICLVLVAALTLSGAVEAQSLPRKVENVAEPAAGQALVVGSIHFLKDGTENKCSVSGMECLLLVQPSTSPRAMVYVFKRGGDFAWSLPPGDYTLLEFQRWDSTWFTTPFRAGFTVPANAKAIYIGDFYLAFSGYRSIAGYRDAYSEAVAKFDAAHPAMVGKLAKALPVYDETLTASGKVSNVCAEDWKLLCAKNMSGVTPQAPSDGKGFDLITSLRPEFRWNAAADNTVTYDLALYEAVSYAQDAFSKQYTEGRLIAYAKGLVQPSWQPDQPLEPDRRYYWSVRLRRGEDVSSWSTYSYFNFFLIGFSSGHGQWFRFITPAK